MENLLFIMLIGLGVWFWLDSLQAREKAVEAAAQACRETGAQLLDQTVALEKLWPARNDAGHLVWRRIYGFDFSQQGYERRRGRAILRGRLLEQVQLDNDEGTTIDLKNL